MDFFHCCHDLRVPTAGPAEHVATAIAAMTSRLALVGRQQAANAAVALAALEELRRQGWNIPDEAVRRGLAELKWPARVEVVARRPAVVLDGAHNVASIEALLETLDESFSVSRRWLLFASTQEKDLRGMIQRVLGRFDEVVFTQYGGQSPGGAGGATRGDRPGTERPAGIRSMPTRGGGGRGPAHGGCGRPDLRDRLAFHRRADASVVQ